METSKPGPTQPKPLNCPGKALNCPGLVPAIVPLAKAVEGYRPGDCMEYGKPGSICPIVQAYLASTLGVITT